MGSLDSEKKDGMIIDIVKMDYGVGGRRCR